MALQESVAALTLSTAPLFKPLQIGSLSLPNRIVMAPMTRWRSPDGVPGPDVAAYYRRRAENDCGLIITEGTTIDHPVASQHGDTPRFHGEALAGWRRVLKEVHGAGGRIMPQIWHVGLMRPREGNVPNVEMPAAGPSGLRKPGKKIAEPMTKEDIRAVVRAYAEAAGAAQNMGFDGVEIHAAHGYLIDQFFWGEVNLRDDEYGGDLVQRTRFAVEVVEAIRRETGPDFPIVFRYSQWKQQDYSVKMARTPTELGAFLAPLSAAGVDVFHCSQRRFWEPEFEGSTLNLAGWTKRLTGKPVITVGSVGLSGEFMSDLYEGGSSVPASLDGLLGRMNADEFDLVAVGRVMIADAEWARKIKQGRFSELKPFDRSALDTLI